MFLYNDKLIFQIKTKRGIITQGKRLPSNSNPILEDVRDILRIHAGNPIPAIKFIRKHYSISLVEAVAVFKKFTGVKNLLERRKKLPNGEK